MSDPGGAGAGGVAEGLHCICPWLAFQVERAMKNDTTGVLHPAPPADAEMVVSMGRHENVSWVNDTRLPLMRTFIIDKFSW